MKNINTLIAFRHGEYDHNVMMSLQGDEAYDVLKRQMPADFNYTMDLNETGVEQATMLRTRLGQHAIHACFFSPYLRTLSTAYIALADHSPSFAPALELKERDLGFFTHVPPVVFHEQYKDELIKKRQHPLDWVPWNGESLRQVGRRVLSVMQAVDTNVAYHNKTVAFSTHADTMVAMRSLPELLNLSEERLKRPLSPELQNPQWIQNCQVDIYTREHPYAPGYLFNEMSFFRSIAAANPKTAYDTGWLAINR